MEFINPPEKSPQNVFHKTFYSQLLNHEIGYNIYLPPGYEDDGTIYPVAYHLHGWTGNQSSEIWPMEKVYRNKRAITVFPNSSPVIEDFENLPVERMIIDEFIPYIDAEYRTVDPRRQVDFRLFDGWRDGVLLGCKISRFVFLGDGLCGYFK